MTDVKPTLENADAATRQLAAARIDEITRVTLRPLGSPMPLGFFTVGLATALVSSLQTGLIDKQAAVAVGLMLIPAFVIQFAVAVFALLSRDAMAATVMGTFSGSWGVTALVLALHPPDVNQALAVFFLLFGGFAGMMAYAAIPKMALCAVLTVAVPHFVAGGLANATGSTPLDRIAGITGFVLMAVALYTAWALMLEDMRGKTILPVGRRGPARAALEGEVVDQLIGLEHAAGVRRTL